MSKDSLPGYRRNSSQRALNASALTSWSRTNASFIASSWVVTKSSGMCQISEKRPLKPVILPSLSTTRMPSAVESSVAVRRDRASPSSRSADSWAVASWADTTKPSTVGSSSRSTMVSSKGIAVVPS